jgi:hypothetical protein
MKDDDGVNWSPTQALPADTTDINNNPNDSNAVSSFPFVWQAVLIGDESFSGDSASTQHVYDTLAGLHEFWCMDQLGRQMILRLPDLDLGTDTLSFSNTTSITLIDGSLVYDSNFNPNGYIIIYSNTNGRVSALFESDLNDNSGSGQDIELVNGILQNVRYE